MTSQQAGRLLASGRDADIFEYGPSLVLRRSRHARSMVTEARVMEHVRAAGVPVPAVDHVSDDGTELVMERIDGASMVDALSRRPWTVWHQGVVLADLHRQVQAVDAPDWLPAAPGPAGDHVVHLDLHPLNVMITRRGPVLIDWSNAGRGDPDFDGALTWTLIANGGVPPANRLLRVLSRARGLLVAGFLRHVDREALRRRLDAAVTWKLTDPNMSTTECDAMRRHAARWAVRT